MLLYVFKPLSSGYNPTLSGAGMQYFVLWHLHLCVMLRDMLVTVWAAYWKCVTYVC